MTEEPASTADDIDLDDADPDDIDPNHADSGADDIDPYKRRVAVVLALLGVLGAWIGIVRIDSANNEATYARETTRTAVQSLRANVNRAVVAGLEVDLDAEQAALALAEPALPEDLGDPEEAADLLGSAEGLGEQDREDLARDQTFEAEQLDLTRKALAQTRVTYNNRTSQYETVLTTLAVALFLVGFTLVLDRRTRPPVLVPGVILAAYVAGWAVFLHQKDVPTTDPAAIDAAAEGAVHDAFGEFDAATERYSTAIGIDEDFVAGYTGRSLSSFLAVNPDFPATRAVVHAEGPEVDLALADAEEAVRLGDGRDFAGLFLAGLYRFYGGDYEGAIDHLDRAAAINDRAAEVPLAVAASELGAGDLDAATEAIDRAVGLLDLDEDSDRNRALAADLFSLIEQVQVAVPERAADVDEVRRRLALGEAGLVFAQVDGQVPAGARVSLDDGRFEAGTLTVGLAYEGMPEDAALSVYVYEHPTESAAPVQPAELARFVRVTGDGASSGSVPVDRTCRPVAFRVDVYVEGAFAGSFPFDGSPPTC